MVDSYNSACAEINPRLEREILDRQRRIHELLRRAAGTSDENNNNNNNNSNNNNNTPSNSSSNNEEDFVDACGITVETKDRKAQFTSRFLIWLFADCVYFVCESVVGSQFF